MSCFPLGTQFAYNTLIIKADDLLFFSTLTSMNYSFRECSNLESIKIPTSVTDLGSYTFALCTKLSYLSLHEGLKTIRTWTFQGLTQQTWIIPSTVTVMSNPFRITGIKTLVMLPTTPPENREDFGNRLPTTIYIPDGSETAYSSSTNNGLYRYSSRFRPLSEWDGSL